MTKIREQEVGGIKPEGFGGWISRIWRSPFTGLGLLIVALSGCGATQERPEPRIVIQEKLVPVSKPCTPSNVASAPQYPDTDEALLAVAGADERYKLLIAGRDLRIARSTVVEPVIEGCRK